MHKHNICNHGGWPCFPALPQLMLNFVTMAAIITFDKVKTFNIKAGACPCKYKLLAANWNLNCQGS